MPQVGNLFIMQEALKGGEANGYYQKHGFFSYFIFLKRVEASRLYSFFMHEMEANRDALSTGASKNQRRRIGG